MFAANGTFHPASGAIRRQFNENEHEKYSSSNCINIRYLPYNGSSLSNTEYDNSNSNDTDKKGSPALRSEFDRFTCGLADIRYNDENDGLVFGSTQLYCDTKQYSWVWRVTANTRYWWVFFGNFCFFFLCTAPESIPIIHILLQPSTNDNNN